jgi:hypothetical protein
LRFFLDNCISAHIAEAIRCLARIQDYEIAHLREKFPEDTVDLDWIPALAEEGGWVIVSGDPKISRDKAERAAWHESGMTAFFFNEPFARKRFWKQAEIVVRWWPEIVLMARKAPKGSGFLVPWNGTEFKLIYDPEK